MHTKFFVDADHKPLVPIVIRKSLHDLTPRLQRLKMRRKGDFFYIFHNRGKSLCAVDALSRHFDKKMSKFSVEMKLKFISIKSQILFRYLHKGSGK